MEERFKELGFKVLMTRRTDTTVDSDIRGKRIASSGAKLCISNHYNGVSNPAAKGFETLRSIHSNGKWGDLVGKYVKEVGVLAYRGNRTRLYPNTKNVDYYFMHRLTGRTETLIVEYFFGTNKEDAENYLEKRTEYLEAVIKATCEYCSVPYTR